MIHKPNNNSPKFVCYPMAGGAEEQVDNLLQSLKWIHDTKPSQRSEVWQWLKTAFRSHKPLADKYAQNIYSVLLSGTGLVEVDEGKCRLTREGYIALHSPPYDHLLTIFAENFVGFVEILEVLQRREPVLPQVLTLEWFTIASERFYRMRQWGQRHISNQFRVRIDWLRAFGVIEVMDGIYQLTSAGRRFTAEHPPDLLLLSPDEIEAEETAIQAFVSTPFAPFDEAVERTQSLRQAYVRSQTFRDIVAREYDYACAVCNFCLNTPDGKYEIQAAHIIPRSKRGTDDPRNGLALCGIHHWVFDKGVITVSPDDLTLLVASYIEAQVDNPSAVQIIQFAGQTIRITRNKEYSPAKVSLQWHNSNVFIG